MNIRRSWRLPLKKLQRCRGASALLWGAPALGSACAASKLRAGMQLAPQPSVRHLQKKNEEVEKKSQSQRMVQLAIAVRWHPVLFALPLVRRLPRLLPRNALPRPPLLLRAWSRHLATRALRSVAWNELPPSERAAWEVLGWTG